MECFEARFINGSRVRLVRNIRNDGSFRDSAKGELLVAEGEIGIIKSSGYFLQDQVIYQVYFPDIKKTVGVRDNEVIDSELPWIPCQFRSLEQAQLTLSLKMRGEIIANKGDLVEVYRVFRDLETGGVEYLVNVANERVWLDAKLLTLPLKPLHIQGAINHG